MTDAATYAPPSNGRLARGFLHLYQHSPGWLAPAAVATCFAGTASLVWVIDPTDGGAAELSGCLVKLTTGLDCPGCGGTRAFFYLMHGNVPQAVRHHAIAVFAAPFLVWLYLAWAVRSISGRDLPMPKISARTVSVFLAAWAAFTVVRNVPFAPFTKLYV